MRSPRREGPSKEVPWSGGGSPKEEVASITRRGRQGTAWAVRKLTGQHVVVRVAKATAKVTDDLLSVSEKVMRLAISASL